MMRTPIYAIKLVTTHFLEVAITLVALLLLNLLIVAPAAGLIKQFLG